MRAYFIGKLFHGFRRCGFFAGTLADQIYFEITVEFVNAFHAGFLYPPDADRAEWKA